jgi:ATP-binding cassette subfamily F protein uup
VLDEPTNDLDAETLDLLEELLLDYTGTLLLVSHDREFLNRVVTSTLVLDGKGTVEEFVGGYDDWLRQTHNAPPVPTPAAKTLTVPPRPRAERARKLTFKENQELAVLPERIATLEEEQAALHATLADPEFYRTAGAAVTDLNQRLAELEQALVTAYARWEELEGLADSLKN